MSMAKMLVNQASAGTIRNGFGQELIAQTALFRSQEYLDTKANARRTPATDAGRGAQES
jgi:hypothetical protein